MTVLDTLNFVAFNPLQNNNPVAARRRKLITKIDEQIWHAPNGWSGLNVSALSAFGPSERCFPVQADDSPMNCVA